MKEYKYAEEYLNEIEKHLMSLNMMRIIQNNILSIITENDKEAIIINKMNNVLHESILDIKNKLNTIMKGGE